MANVDQPSGASPTLWRRAIGPAALFVLVVMLYAPSMSNDFIYDDNKLILKQIAPRSVGDIIGVFAERHWYNLPYYRPVPRLTMVLQKFLHGDHAGPYHLFNTMLIGFAALLAYALLRLPVFAFRPVPALLGAALFAVHPIASLCVYPICSGRETLMPVVFIIAAVYSFLRGGRRWYILSLLMFVVSLLSKEQAVVVPGLLVLADVLGVSVDAPGRSVRGWVRRYAPVAVILIVYFLIRWLLFGGTGEHHLAVFEHPSGLLLSLLYTLQTMFVPFVQLVYEPRVEIWGSAWRLLVWQFVVVLLAVGAYRCWPAVRTAVLFWLGWFFLALLPTANLLTQEARFAERYGFLALVSVIGIVGTLASTVWDRPAARRVMTGVGITFLVACAAISFHRSRYFQNDFTFHSQWLHTNPQLALPHINLGFALVAKGRVDEAIGHYTEALRINPGYADAHNNLGIALVAKDKVDEAIDHYTEALRIEPGHADAHNNLGNALVAKGKVDKAIDHYTEALRIKPGHADAHNNLGIALIAKGKVDEAIGHYTEALRIKPGYADAHNNLGNALVAKGKVDEAIGHYTEALRIKPGYADAHYNLGNALVAQGKVDEAIDHYTEALRIKPGYADAHYNLGNALVAQGKVDEAIDHYTEALRIKPGDVEAHNGLGAALIRKGKTDEAVVHFREALRIRPNYADARNNLKKVLAASGKIIDKTIAKIQEKLKLNPGDPALHYKLGNLYKKKGELDEAIDHYQKTLSIQPRFIGAVNNLAMVFSTKREYDKSVSMFKKMIELRPDSAGAYYNIACIYAKQNKIKDSVEWLKKAIEKGYDNWDLIKTDKDLENIRASSYYEGLIRGQ